MDNPFSPENRLVETSRVGHFFVDAESTVRLPLHQTVSMRLADMPNVRIEEEEISRNVKSLSTQVTIEVRCTGYSKDSARILGRIQPIPLSDINGQQLDAWIALRGGEADAVFLAPGQPVPQVSRPIQGTPRAILSYGF